MRFWEKGKRIIKFSLKYNPAFQLFLMKKGSERYGEKARFVCLSCKSGKYGQFAQMLTGINISISPEKRFQHWIDEGLSVYNHDKVIGNMPPDYRMILDFSLQELLSGNSGANKVAEGNRALLTAVSDYIDRILLKLKEQEQTEYISKTTEYFNNMKTGRAECLEEALQRILFWSSLFWQSGHKLIGLGRLDMILDRFSPDQREGTLRDPETKEILKDFLMCLHDHYAFKSNTLPGDIGQIIILGGMEEDGTYFCNSLTGLFIETLMELRIPDPKILLRTCRSMPTELLESALQSITTGIGSPLLSNDEVIIPALIDFGYRKKDAYGYVTSACWEPVSYGNSLEQNNLANINFAEPFVRTMEDLGGGKVNTYDEFVSLYEKYLISEVKKVFNKISGIRWEPDPLFTLFTDGCLDSGKDISDGGAEYNDYGILSVGLGNAVNSLLNVKKLFFEQHRLTTEDVCKVWKKRRKDISSEKRITDMAADMEDSYGHDREECVNLTNRLLSVTENAVSGFRNRYGGKVKFGLSSPDYINQGVQTGATFDGRNSADPLMVHISARGSTAYTELVSFAAQIKYNGWNANANVVDYFVSPDFIRHNFDKFLRFLQLSIKKGFFQMQMNVVSSDTLLAAKKNPEEFPNLIVRVWGFSAYFKDLPETYQDVLIHRAMVSEGHAA